VKKRVRGRHRVLEKLLREEIEEICKSIRKISGDKINIRIGRIEIDKFIGFVEDEKMVPVKAPQDLTYDTEYHIEAEGWFNDAYARTRATMLFSQKEAEVFISNPDEADINPKDIKKDKKSLKKPVVQEIIRRSAIIHIIVYALRKIKEI